MSQVIIGGGRFHRRSKVHSTSSNDNKVTVKNELSRFLASLIQRSPLKSYTKNKQSSAEAVYLSSNWAGIIVVRIWSKAIKIEQPRLFRHIGKVSINGRNMSVY